MAVEAELLSTTEKIVGQPFHRGSATARVTLCDTPSRSFPVMVNMWYALASFTSSPVPMHVKVGTLYHELLHTYIAEFLPTSSDLLQQYTHEHERVTGHLHLLALQAENLFSQLLCRLALPPSPPRFYQNFTSILPFPYDLPAPTWLCSGRQMKGKDV
jgi:hypothetical protein